MTKPNQKAPLGMTPKELRQLAQDLRIEMRQVSKKVDDICAVLYVEAQKVRLEARARRNIASRHAVTVLHGPNGRSTRKDDGEQ